MTTIGLCGGGGCPLSRSVDVAIPVQAKDTASVQQGHLAIEHALCRALERLLLDSDGALVTAAAGSVLTLPELLDLRAAWKAAGRVVVWTNGCFDLFHSGHLASLKAARRLGDVLLVGVNSDRAVHRLKGDGRPLIPEGERAAIIAGAEIGRSRHVFDEDTPEAVHRAAAARRSLQGRRLCPSGRQARAGARQRRGLRRAGGVPAVAGRFLDDAVLETVSNHDSWLTRAGGFPGSRRDSDRGRRLSTRSASRSAWWTERPQPSAPGRREPAPRRGQQPVRDRARADHRGRSSIGSRKVIGLLAGEGIVLDGTKIVPTHPKPGAIQEAQSGNAPRSCGGLRLDLGRSFMIGDKVSDVEAGERAGCATVLLGSGTIDGESTRGPDFVASGWSAAVRPILESVGAR